MNVNQDVQQSGRLVADVMTTSVVSAHEHAFFKEIVDAMHRNRIGAVPVINMDRQVVGVISEVDLMARIAGRGAADFRPRRLGSRSAARRKVRGSDAAELMTSPPVTVTETTTIREAARLLHRAGIHHLPVVDRSGVLVGIVSQADLLAPYLRSDARIEDDVRDVLAAMGKVLVRRRIRIAPGSVGVVVEEGVVFLSGAIASSAVR